MIFGIYFGKPIFGILKTMENPFGKLGGILQRKLFSKMFVK
jgi:hypothetical protein